MLPWMKCLCKCRETFRCAMSGRNIARVLMLRQSIARCYLGCLGKQRGGKCRECVSEVLGSVDVSGFCSTVLSPNIAIAVLNM